MEPVEFDTLPGLAERPTVTLHYAPTKAIEIPIFIITNDMERWFFREIYNRYLNLGRYLIHRRLYIREPYSGVNDYKTPILSEKSILAIHDVAKQESIRFKATVSVEIRKNTKYYFNGEETIGLPEGYSDRVDSRHWQKNIDEFQAFYKLNEKGFRYGHSHFYGDSDSTQIWK